MGLSNLRRISELVDGVDKLFHVDTITDEVDSESLTWEPGRKAMVLAHNDLAVDGPGVQLMSFLYSNGMAGSLSNYLLWTDPRGS